MRIKVVIVGDTGTGKTALIENTCPASTDPDAASTVNIEGMLYTVCDTKNANKYRTLSSTFYKNIHAVCIVFDLTDRETFDNVCMWAGEVRLHTIQDIPIIIVGNKRDLYLERKVSPEEAIQKAKEMNVDYIETSKDEGLRMAFWFIAKRLRDFRLRHAVRETPARVRHAGQKFRIKGTRRLKKKRSEDCNVV